MNWANLFQAVGAVVLGCVGLLAIVGLAGYLFIRYNVGKLKKNVELMGGLIPPSTITLIPNSEPWNNEKGRVEIEKRFLENGFKPVSSKFSTKETPAKVQAFYDPERFAYAAIYAFPGHDLQCDIVRMHEDGSMLSVSNGTTYSDTGRPSWSRIIRLPGQSVVNLIQEIDLNPPTQTPVPVSEDSFKEHFEEAYRRSFASRIEAINFDAAAIKSAGDLTGVELTKEQRDLLWGKGQFFDSDDEREYVISRYLNEAGPSALDWERQREQVFVVTSRHSSEEAGSAFLRFVGRDLVDLPEGLTTDPFETLDRLVNDLGLGDQIETIFEFEAPIKAKMIHLRT